MHAVSLQAGLTVSPAWYSLILYESVKSTLLFTSKVFFEIQPTASDNGCTFFKQPVVLTRLKAELPTYLARADSVI